MRMSLVQFRETMAEPVNRVMYQGERIVLERHGKGVAVVVSMQDLNTLEALEDTADVKAAKQARKESGAVPWEQVKAELGLAGSKSDAKTVATRSAAKPASRKSRRAGK